MNRRSFIKLVGTSAGAYMIASLSGCMEAAQSSSRSPNIIYIMADDLGYGDLSCYGQDKFSTPNIDRLAKEGMKFTDHYAGCTVCAPSRCSLMTGLHTGHCYIRGNREVKPEGQAPMPPDTVTVAKLLKQKGYTTGIFGKWGLGGPGSGSEPNDQGFDKFFGYNCQRQAHSYYPTHLWNNRKKVMLPENEGGKTETYSHDLIAEEALKFLKENKDRPFFMYVPFTIPHAAMQVPDDSLNQFLGKFPEVKSNSGGYAKQDHPRAAFAAMVTRMDGDVGKIMDTLKMLGIDNDTLVIFTSDNGPHKEGGHDSVYFNSNGPLRGFKRDLYEGGIRVPFLARWPGKVKAGSVTDHPSAFWDLMPTACDIAGAGCPDNIDGISYLPTLLGKKQPKHEYLYWEFHEQGTKQAVRMGKWKGVYLIKADKFELYDLSKDIGEENNIASDNPTITEKIRGIMKSARVPSELFKLPKLDSKG